MAQFAELVLTARTDGLRAAKTDLASLTRAGADAESGMRKSMSGVEQATGRVPRAANSAAAAFDNLRMSIDPLYAQSRQYEAAVRQVDAAVSAGVATQAQANRVLDLASQRYLGTANSARLAADAAANVNATMGGNLNGVRNLSLQLGQVAQQGAVTGDYLGALAIQSGDMLLGFGTLGAVLGVVAAVLAPMAIDLLKNSEAAAQLNFNITALQPVLSGLASVMAPIGSAIGGAFTTMAENLDRVVIIAGTAATLFAGKYVAGVVAARVATLSFAASLATLRSALIRTGIGALVIGAGELVFQFTRLVQAAGGFGEAMGLLGDVAGAVWQGIVDSGAAVPPALNGVWNLMKAGFLEALSGMATAFHDFIWGISRGLSEVEGFESVALALDKVVASADNASGTLMRASGDAKRAADGAFSDAAGAISTAFDPAKDKVAELADVVASAETNSVSFGGALDDLGDKAGGSGGAASQINELANEIERLEDAADPTRKFRREMEQLDLLLANGLSDGAYANAVADLNEELVNSTPILSDVNDAFGQMVDYMFDGFKDGMAGIWDIFVNTLKSMAAAALKNKITISLGLAAGGTGGAALAGQGGGLLSNVLGLGGGGGGLLSGVGSGLMGVLSGGGLGSSFANLGGLLSGSVAGAGAWGAALPAIGIVAGIPLLLGALMKKTEVVVAEGVRARIDGAMLELDSYQKTKTNNGLGISSGFSRDFERLDEAVQAAVGARLDATIDALGAFGLGTDLTGFSFSKRTEIKDGETFEGESEEVIREALNAAIEYLSDGALELFQMAGESLSETLERLTLSLNTVNPLIDVLGDNILPISLEGADAASALAQLAGGLDAFASKATFVFDNFLTDAEKMDIASASLNSAFQEMGLTYIPQTHEAFRDLMDAQDLTTQGGRELYAALLDVAPLFVEVKGTAQEVADAAANDLNPALNDAADAIDDTADAARELAAIESERLGLVRELFTVMGNEDALRQMQIDGLDESNRALQEHIWALQDQADAAEEAARATRAALQLTVDAAQDALSAAQDLARRSFAAEADRINALHDAQIDAVRNAADTQQDAIDAAEDALAAARGLLDRSFEAAADQLTAIADRQIAAVEDRLARDIAAIQSSYDAQIEAAETVRDNLEAAADATAQALTVATDLLNRSFAAEADRLTEFYNAQIDLITEQREAAAELAAEQRAAMSDQVGITRDIQQALEGALSSRRALGDDALRFRFGQATSFLSSAIASGGTNDEAGLDAALSAVADPSTRMFASLEEFQLAYKINTAQIAELAEINGETLTTEERMLRELTEQGTQAEQDADDQIRILRETLDSELEALEANRLAVLGVDTSVVALSDAIAAYEDALAANEAAQAALAADNTAAVIEGLQDAAATQIAGAEAAANRQIDQLRTNLRLELEELQAQKDAILGVDTSVVAVGDAVTAFQDAEAALELERRRLNALETEATIDAIDQARDDQLAALDDQLNALLGIETGIVSVADAVAGVEAAAAALANAVAALDDFDNNAGGGSGGGSGTPSAAIQPILDELATITGATSAALAGADALGLISDNGQNAILSATGQALLSGLAADVAAVYAQELNRNADVSGLSFYVDAIESGAFSLVRLVDELANSTEAITGVIPGFSTGGTGGGSIGNLDGGAPIYVQDPALDPIAIANGTALFPKPDTEIGRLYGSLGVPISEAGYNFWTGTGLTGSDLYSAFVAAAQEDGTLRIVPSYRMGTDFHPGGLARLHENELVNLPRGTSVSTAGEVREMVTALRAMQQQNARIENELKQIRRRTNDMADIAEDHDRNGTPGTRTGATVTTEAAV